MLVEPRAEYGYNRDRPAFLCCVPRRDTMRVFRFDLLPDPERLDHLNIEGFGGPE